MVASQVVEPGGSLLIAWQLKDRRVVIIGGGEIASQRLVAVLSADALVTLIAPRAGLHPAITRLLASPARITYHDRKFGGQDDLAGADMVLAAIDDPAASHAICALCRTLRVPVNVADVPPLCDFYFGAQVRRGPLQVLVSTNGHGPRLAHLVGRRIEAALPRDVGAAVEKVGLLRQRLRQRAPGVGGTLGKRRMRWISNVCETWPLADLAQLEEDSIERLLDTGWERNTIPSPSRIIGTRLQWRGLLPDSTAPFALGLLTGLLAVTVWLLLANRRNMY